MSETSTKLVQTLKLQCEKIGVIIRLTRNLSQEMRKEDTLPASQAADIYDNMCDQLTATVVLLTTTRDAAISAAQLELKSKLEN